MLLGDAAHALPNETGQGVSRAIEDAVAYAILLHRFPKDYEKVARAYESVRMGRIAHLLAQGLQRSSSKKQKGWWSRGGRNESRRRD